MYWFLDSCPYISHPKNGNVVKSKFSVGDAQRSPFHTVATFGCNDGFSLSGTKTRTCQTSTQWTGENPTCIQSK